MSLRVLFELQWRLKLLAAGLAGERPAPGQLLAVLLHVGSQLALQSELIPTLAADEVLFLLMEHDMRFQTSHSGEPLVTHRTAGVVPIVGAFMKCQVELNIKGLGAQVTSMWLVMALVAPHVALKLGLFGEREQTEFTFMEVCNLTGIINILHIQC